jgi:DNA-binding NtrC family response regulator
MCRYNSNANSDATPSILLVDDDETIRNTLPHALREEGFNVALAQNGRRAPQRSRHRHYAVAHIIDMNLPEMDRAKLLSILKAKNPELKQIVITEYPSIENTVKAIDSGVAAYIMKPFQPTQLIAKIKKELKR